MQSQDPQESRATGFRANAYKNRKNDGDAAIIRGAKLYDQWFEPDHGPTEYFPGVSSSSGFTASDSWRCVSCHDWNGSGSGYALNSLVGAQQGVEESKIYDTIKVGFSFDDSGEKRHIYKDYLSDDQIYDLLYFIKQGMKFPETYQPAPPLDGVRAKGNSINGKYWYGQPNSGIPTCANVACHGTKGTGPGALSGRAAASNPWRFLHMVRFGPAYTSQNVLLDNHSAADLIGVPNGSFYLNFTQNNSVSNPEFLDSTLSDILSYVQNSLPVSENGGNPLHGALLYDNFFKLNPAAEPAANPLWVNGSYRKQSVDEPLDPKVDPTNLAAFDTYETWRCVTCHGWDYKGDEGAFGLTKKSGYYSGFPGLLHAAQRGTQGLAQQFTDIIYNGYQLADQPNPYHRFADGGFISLQDAKDLAAFLLTELVDVDDYFPRIVNQTYGDYDAGAKLFNNEGLYCASAGCHSPADEAVRPIGQKVYDNRYTAFHHIRFGISPNMPSAAEYGYAPTDVMNIMTYIINDYIANK